MHVTEFLRKKRYFDDVQMKIWAESEFEPFVRLVSPQLLLGDIHVDLMEWMTASTTRLNQLILLPRGHLKSRLMALRAAWILTKNPAETILYVSATADLAEKQLGLIKQILSSAVYNRYWPEMVHKDEMRRRRWTTSEIIVDHRKREVEQIRDPSVKTAGMTSNITGLHCTTAILDDIVVPGNAYTEEGRRKVESAVSQIAAIKEPDRPTLVVGTRYHPDDVYNTMMNQSYPVFDDDTGEYLRDEPIYDVYVAQVEEDGRFLWPRAKRPDGQWFGFDRKILARIRAEYSNPVHFYANYYNEPNDLESEQIDSVYFQEFEIDRIRWSREKPVFEGRRLNVYAAIDFAFSRSKKADFTALVVIGVDYEHNVYVLDIHRFKTDKISEYFAAIEETHLKWHYRKIRAEVTVAQQSIVRELKDNYIKPRGLRLSVDEYRPSRHEGDKHERIMGVIEPRYSNYQVWHSDKLPYKSDLEAELLLENAPTDDIINALADAISISTAPSRPWNDLSVTSDKLPTNARFGGVAYGR